MVKNIRLTTNYYLKLFIFIKVLIFIIPTYARYLNLK
jgi:hypothetical protein